MHQRACMKFEGTIYPSGLDIRRDPTRGYFITARISIPAGSNIIKVPIHRTPVYVPYPHSSQRDLAQASVRHAVAALTAAVLAQEAPWATGVAMAALQHTCRRCLALLTPKQLASPIRCDRCAQSLM